VRHYGEKPWVRKRRKENRPEKGGEGLGSLSSGVAGHGAGGAHRSGGGEIRWRIAHLLPKGGRNRRKGTFRSSWGKCTEGKEESKNEFATILGQTHTMGVTGKETVLLMRQDV